MAGKMQATIAERLARRTVREGRCLVWTGNTNGAGYGIISAQPPAHGNVYVHRLAYELAKGPIAPLHDIDHTCRRTLCVKPEHLDAVPHKVNLARKFKRGYKKLCKRGHDLSGPTAFVDKHGHRQCRLCLRLKYRAYHARKKAALKA